MHAGSGPGCVGKGIHRVTPKRRALSVAAASATEAQKTEPDKNTYLVFPRGLAGADASYNYGTHFLFQGHEGGAGGASYITRINLDADAAHRVTLLATAEVHGQSLATIDGSTDDVLQVGRGPQWLRQRRVSVRRPGDVRGGCRRHAAH